MIARMRRVFSLVRLFLVMTITLWLAGCSASLQSVKGVDSNQSQESVTGDLSSGEEDMDDAFSDEFAEEFAVKEVYDPLSGYNRFMTKFNDTFYTYILDPVARGYRAVLHKEVRSSIGNFFHNLLYPVRLVNNVLQLKFKNAMEETGRFVVNSTIGILGLFDPAKAWLEWEPHEEDFGQTLGFYGVGGGFHVVLPFLGPSNLRDMFSMYPDAEVDPNYYVPKRGYNLVSNDMETIGLISLEKVNFTSQHIGEYEDLKKDAVDLYPFLRDIYEQHREKLIKE